jgi:hypothetical protein
LAQTRRTLVTDTTRDASPPRDTADTQSVDLMQGNSFSNGSLEDESPTDGLDADATAHGRIDNASQAWPW